MEELRTGGILGVHSWIEGASGDGRRVSWFAPQNQGGFGSSRHKVVEARASVSGLTEATGVDGVYGLAAGEEVTGVGRRQGPSEGRGGNDV